MRISVESRFCGSSDSSEFARPRFEKFEVDLTDRQQFLPLCSGGGNVEFCFLLGGSCEMTLVLGTARSGSLPLCKTLSFSFSYFTLLFNLTCLASLTCVQTRPADRHRAVVKVQQRMRKSGCSLGGDIEEGLKPHRHRFQAFDIQWESRQKDRH